VRQLTSLPFEVHLMVDGPERHWPAFAEAGADLLIVHAETTRHLHRLLSEIRAAGKATGVALNPATPIDAVRYVIELVDLLLVMTVNPGWGGQTFIPAMLDKVAEARSLLDRAGSMADLEVDGGVSESVAAELVHHGATVLVAGSAVHRHPSGRASAIQGLREAARSAAALNRRPAADLPAEAAMPTGRSAGRQRGAS
jgi:ribulose-phosphate 3-epimerase